MPADYTALKTAWGTTGLPSGVTGTALASGMTPQQKLAAMQSWTIPGPMQDVPVSSAIGELGLALDGAVSSLFQLEAFAATAANGNATHDAALTAAQLLCGKPGSLFPGMLVAPQAPPFRMSDPAVYAKIKGMLDAILAEETASPGTTGITQAVHDALLALAQGTPQGWDRAPVSNGGAGLPGYLNATDLVLAGLVTTAEFPGA